MDKKKLGECIKGLLNIMTAEEDKESQEIIKDSLEKLNSSGYNLSNPEDFNVLLMYKLKRAVREVAKTMHETPSESIKDTNKPNFIYMQYDFLESNIRELCTSREGSCCCADKSRSILKMYLKYSLTGKIPEFDPSVENYWTPNFGTYQEWIELCDGLYELHYGKPVRYLKAYSVLVQAEIRKYKHIHHTWFIRFKDGEVVKFNDSWDKKQENPLDNEYCDKGDYYIVFRKYVKHRNYEIHEGKGIMRNHYCKVPKSDIEEIYKVSEEKMI